MSKEKGSTQTLSRKGRRRQVNIPDGYLTLEEVIKQVEREHIQKTLELTNWNLQKASRILDIARNTLKSKMKKYNIL